MTYTILRASDKWGEKGAPCEKAVLRRPYDDDMYKDAIYTIEIESLQDLTDLISEVGRIVIYPDSQLIWDDSEYGNMPSIIIYDDYIE